MGRKKIRNYPSAEDYKREIKEWFIEHRSECEHLLLQKFGYENIEQLKEDEYRMAFGWDCGFVELYPTDPEMVREWELDNGKGCAFIHDIATYGYPTQSVTLKEPLVDYMLKETELDKIFVSYSKLN